MLFDKVIAFDNFRQKIILIVNISLESPETEYNKAAMELNFEEAAVLRDELKELKIALRDYDD